MYTANGPARLVLEDGSEFPGRSFGAIRTTSGEVVFNTGMVGYPESLSDPSYRGQILVMTYPLIGNYGVPPLDRDEDGLCRFYESEKLQIEGLIVTDYCDDYSHWSAKESLGDLMKQFSVPGIQGIDTRELTKKLRDRGTMLGKIVYGNEDCDILDPNERNLAAEVSITQPVIHEKGRTRIILVDCGVKNNIIRAFLKRHITVIRVPWDFNVMEEKADGIVISNGPGDPEKCEKTIRNVRSAMKWNIPIFGICLGSQVLGLSAGAGTFKLKYGHRGLNQPCLETGTRRCYITSQNHGYAVDSDSLPRDWREWFINDNDKTNEGIIHISKPFFGTQFHPEASPGPDDTEFLFDMFLRAME